MSYCPYSVPLWPNYLRSRKVSKLFFKFDPISLLKKSIMGWSKEGGKNPFKITIIIIITISSRRADGRIVSANTGQRGCSAKRESV